MRVRKCCVIDCPNNKKNCRDVQFYNFPVVSHKREQRKKWINAVKILNPDGSKWEPTKNDQICSVHFAGNAKSDNQFSPSYVSTLFPDIYKKTDTNVDSAIARHERFMKRRNQEVKKPIVQNSINVLANEENVVEEQVKLTSESVRNYLNQYVDSSPMVHNMEVETCSQECQVDFLTTDSESCKTFICNRYCFMNNVCDAEIQTEICEQKRIIIPNRLKFSDKKCGTPTITYEDKCIGCNETELKERGFLDIESIKSNDQLIDLAGVTFSTFKLFADKLVPDMDNCKISKENRLLIFFTKMKTGLTYSSLSVIFQLHRTTISRIFIDTLQYLSSALRNCIKWIDKDCVQGMIPESFKPKYSNVRIIIDCTEFPIEIPSGIDNRIYTYSHYKKGFTAKVLIGYTPNGLITFKSACAGGRKSDSQITIESGLLNLLENDDVILADKGFPEIRTKINENGKL